MMEMEEICETLIFNLTLTQLITEEDFSAFIFHEISILT
jgi:hypothetical protein